jgi:hypothetical protein
MPSILPYWCEIVKKPKDNNLFFSIFAGFEFLVQTVREICQIFISSNTISVTWIILSVGLIYSCSPIAGYCLFVLLTVNKEIRLRKNKNKNKKTGHGVCWIVFTVQRIRWTDTSFKLLLCFVLVFTHNFRTK